MTLDKKVPWSIPELGASHVQNIATRVKDQKPLGMFRISDIEFLLCYEGLSSVGYLSAVVETDLNII